MVGVQHHHNKGSGPNGSSLHRRSSSVKSIVAGGINLVPFLFFGVFLLSVLFRMPDSDDSGHYAYSSASYPESARTMMRMLDCEIVNGTATSSNEGGGGDIMSSPWDLCRLQLEKVLQRRKAGALTKDEHLAAANHRVLDYAISRARERLQSKHSVYPPIFVTDKIKILKPPLEEFAPEPKWRNVCSPDFTIAGLPKTGTSHLSHVLAAHPQAARFSEKVEFWFSRTFAMNAGFSTEEQHTLQEKLYAFHERQYAVVKKQAVTAKNIKTFTNAFFADDIVLRNRYLRPDKPQRFIILLRDPAEWMWAAWNFWVQRDIDAKPPPRLDWADPDYHYRSPELFHELLSAGDRLKSHAWFDGLRHAAIEIPRKLVSAFGRDAIFFGKSEDMRPSVVDNKGGFLDQLSNFTGLDRRDFSQTVAKTIHNCNRVKGNEEECEQGRTDAYAIAGGRPMLPETRRLAYLYFALECQIWKDEFGVEFRDCLDALPSSPPAHQQRSTAVKP